MTNANRGLLQFVAHQPFWVIAVCVGSALSHVGTSTMPFQVGALMDGTGLSPSQAGFFGFCQVGALAAGMILISPWIDRIPPTMVATGSALLSASANAGLFLVHVYPAQLLFGVLAGLGFGFVFAATIASAAACEDADRLYAIGNGGALLLIMAIMAALPVIATHFGALGIFVGIAVLALACSLCFVGFRRAAHIERVPIAAWRTEGAPGLLFSWAAFSIGTGALYAFSERIGKGIHIEPEAIGVVLSAGVFVGVLGTAAAAFLGGRVHRQRALIGGMLGSGLSCLLLGYAPGLLVFAAGIFVYWICYMFLYSYLLGTAAQLDATGRVGTLGGGMERLGYGVGAWLGGVLAEHAGYAATGALGFAGCILGLVIGYPSLFRALARRATASARAPAGAVPDS